jgi:dolichol-phosphate mannosyltransferase
MSMMGFITAFFSFLLGFYYILQKFIQPDITPGLPTTVLVVTFFSGVQLMCIGILGEYIGRIYDEVKDRPMYIIDKIIDTQKD